MALEQSVPYKKINIRSFFTTEQFERARERARKNEPFELVGVAGDSKGSPNRIKIKVDGFFVNDDLAERIWHGHNYLVGFMCDYHGKKGQGGSGMATENFSFMETWEDFKAWIDRKMSPAFEEYEVEEFGQMSLF